MAELHQGQTTERNTKSASARVGFDDLSKTVSGLMQVLFPAVGGWNFFYTPKIGDQVVTIRLPNGTEEGYILGKVYTAGKMPQGGDDDIFLMVSDNGKNVIRFDAIHGTFDIIVDQNAVECFKSLDVDIKENRATNIGQDDELLIGRDQTTHVVGKSLHESSDTDIKSKDEPVGIEGKGTQLGRDALQVFLNDLEAVLSQYIFLPALPPGAVPPVAVSNNAALGGLCEGMLSAISTAKTNIGEAIK